MKASPKTILLLALGVLVGAAQLSACTTEDDPGYLYCPDGTPCYAGSECRPLPEPDNGYACVPETCGNGIIEPLEECDDGELNSDTAPDACRLFCLVPRCGDGVIDSGETCDDGNWEDRDDCPSGSSGSCMLATCGDGFLWTVEFGGTEECDDGNDNLQDSCPSGPDGTCQPAICGDGLVQLGVEACDCGTDPSNLPAGCTSVNSDTVDGACRTDCVLSVCGDGVLDAGEECDDGVQNSDFLPDACRSNCLYSYCGDAVMDTGEDCDCGLDSNNLPVGCTEVNNDTTPGPCYANCTST